MGLLGTPSVLLAYIDLGTGSYLLQLAVAALLGSLFAVKASWPKARAFFRRLFLRDRH
ncbi:MAG: hypothetical protein JW952_00625 [Candidatus Eisenbacteria bacterium]|nr:hypothetical protein [Candidatus Eisenbacteria bacterium]